MRICEYTTGFIALQTFSLLTWNEIPTRTEVSYNNFPNQIEMKEALPTFPPELFDEAEGQN